LCLRWFEVIVNHIMLRNAKISIGYNNCKTKIKYFTISNSLFQYNIS
jgi:hypothetical protein